jgi:hypothetical protein
VIKLLLSSGANVNIKSKEGKSPFIVGFEAGNLEILQMFGGNIDLNNDPSLFFAFSKFSVFKQNIQ